MPRKKTDAQTWYRPPADDVCPLCGRIIPPEQKDAHHLIPKMKGGRETQFMHRICHRQIHALFSESELAQHYCTVEALLAHPEIQKFVNWIKRKPPGFYDRSKRSKQWR
ncbi:HNH endonuclease signature motif containing protein [Massilia sp. W12]|uniref:HNH endonuclease n=1 Tax=Massilia sp. W12 TaxID=3126507 RepID=UPI0030D43D3D